MYFFIYFTPPASFYAKAWRCSVLIAAPSTGAHYALTTVYTVRVDGGRRAVSFFFLFLLWTGSKSRPLSASWISLWHRRRKVCWVFNPEETTDDLLKINNENLRQLVWSRLGVFSCWCSGYFQRVDRQAKKKKKSHSCTFIGFVFPISSSSGWPWPPSGILHTFNRKYLQSVSLFPNSHWRLGHSSRLPIGWMGGVGRVGVWGVGCVYQFNRSVF